MSERAWQSLELGKRYSARDVSLRSRSRQGVRFNLWIVTSPADTTSIEMREP
jgi:hypothetical protein